MRAIICALCLFCSAALADEAADGPPRGLSHHGFVSYTATVDKWCTDESDCSGSRGAQFGIPAHAFYSKSKILSVRYNFDQNWSAMLQIMRTKGSNTELATEERRAVTDRVGLRISYSW